MNDTLKAAARIGAELGAAKAENEKLRGLLREVRVLLANSSYKISGTAAFLSSIDNALSQQAEPECSTCNDVGIIGHSDICPECADTWTPKAEPAPAQDEQSPEQMLSREQIENIARKVHGDCIRLPGATYQHAAEAAVMYTVERIARPAQTEQQPVAWGAFHFGGRRSGKLYTHCETEEQIERYIADLHRSNDSITLRKGPLYAAPIAQTAQQGKFRMGDLVKKSTGSEWEGRVVGWYSTEQTKEGYAVESEAHAGSVQIYPAKALEAVDD